MSNVTAKQFVGHRVREGMAHVRRLTQASKNPRLVMLPCHGQGTGSSNLRAWAIGKALRSMGWRVTVIPAQCELIQRERIIRMEKPDIIFIQKGRHPLNWPKYYPTDIPLVFDLDDADFLDDKQTEQVRSCCENSQAVICGSQYIADWCRKYNSKVTIVWTGTPEMKRERVRTHTHNNRQKPVLTWAHSDPMGSKIEAKLVQEVVLECAKRSEFDFWLYGVNGQEGIDEYLKVFQEAGVSVRTFSYMSYKSFLASLNGVAVGLNPVCIEEPFSRGKSFGKVLAYLHASVAIVSSNTCEYPHFFKNGINGYLADNTKEWVEYTCRLLDNKQLRQSVSDSARKDFLKYLTIDAAAKKVDLVLRKVLDATKRRLYAKSN